MRSPPVIVCAALALFGAIPGRADDKPKKAAPPAGAPKPAAPAPAIPPPGLRTKVSFRVEAGPVPAALESVAKQTGVVFSVLPELLPPDAAVTALDWDGPLAEGLDRLLKPVPLLWEAGEFGGIVVLPTKISRIAPADWAADRFDTTGIEVLEPSEEGQTFGIKAGDVVVAMNGQSFPSYRDFYSAILNDVKPEQEFSFTVKRGDRLQEFKATRTRGDYTPNALFGLERWEDHPSRFAQYENAGHRDPRWDGKFREVCDEVRKDLLQRKSDRIVALARECRALGCRDPQLSEMIVFFHNEYPEELWEEMERMEDPGVLRTAYGGSRIHARAWAAAAFALQGGPRVRERVRPLVECAWAWVRGGTPDRLRRWIGHAVAALHYVEGRYADCIRIMEVVQPDYIREPHHEYPYLHLQALARLGRYDEAQRLQREYFERIPLERNERYAGLLADTAEALPKNPELARDRLEGPVGLLGWRTLTVLQAMHERADGQPVMGKRRIEDTQRENNRLYGSPRGPFYDTVEVYLFPKVVKAYHTHHGVSGVVMNNSAHRDSHSGVGYTVMSNLRLMPLHGDEGHSASLLMPGFVNTGDDVVRVYKTSEVATVRCNGTWIATDVSAENRDLDELYSQITCAQGNIDIGVLIPTKRCYDNDRIRELLMRILDPAEKMSAVEAAKLWDEACLLAPPPNFMTGPALRKNFRPALLKQAPHPKYVAPPPLDELTAGQATERFAKRGPKRWILPDPLRADDVWCARPDGVVEVMSRIRYFTTTLPQIREAVGAPVAVGEPVFAPDALWFPTDRGLFRYDRKEEALVRVPLGGVFRDVPVTSIALSGTTLRVATADGRAGGAWTLDAARGAWSSPGAAAPAPSAAKEDAPPPAAASEASRLLQRAQNYRKNGLRAKAVDLLQQILKDHPGTPEAKEAAALLPAWEKP